MVKSIEIWIVPVKSCKRNHIPCTCWRSCSLSNPWAGILNIYRDIHWAWTYSLYLGIMLITWILVEIIWIGHDILQTIFGLVGVLIVILALLPVNMRYFGWHTSR
jgi:hypothetical protein